MNLSGKSTLHRISRYRNPSHSVPGHIFRSSDKKYQWIKIIKLWQNICYYYKNERSKITDNNVERLQYWPLIITENHTFVFTLFQNPSIFGGSGNRVATALFYVSSKDDDEFIYSFMCCWYYTFWFNIQRNTCLLLSHNSRINKSNNLHKTSIFKWHPSCQEFFLCSVFWRSTKWPFRCYRTRQSCFGYSFSWTMLREMGQQYSWKQI